MSRPHEETWTFKPSAAHSGFVCFPRGEMLVKFDPANYSHDEGEAKARLAAQAPAMARMLLTLEWEPQLAEYGGDVCRHCGQWKKEGPHHPGCAMAELLRAAGIISSD